MRRKGLRKRSQVSACFRVFDLQATRIKGESALAARSNSTPNLSSSQALDTSDLISDPVRGNAAASSVLPSRPPWLHASKKKGKHSPPTRSSSRSKSRPIWLENDSGK
ncbi:uncharacterized protein LOC114959278 [Acropora millepora]|uniref:uncharacterized protein LOC114959278 n=1 Tax=Acropora millepora TaxID=45264 RepID=UPI001CF5FDD1|nr:uncharacterized protein LOC114959278 [Acropora millepora]